MARPKLEVSEAVTLSLYSVNKLQLQTQRREYDALSVPSAGRGLPVAK